MNSPGRVAVAAQRLMGAAKIVQRQHVGKIVGAAALGGGLGLLRFGEGGGIVAGRIEILKALLRGGDVDLLRHGRPRLRSHRKPSMAAKATNPLSHPDFMIRSTIGNEIYPTCGVVI